VTLNLLVLSYLHRDFDFWKQTTLEFVNNVVQNSEVFVTLFLVKSSSCPHKVESLLDKKIELRQVNLSDKVKADMPFEEAFFDVSNQTKIFQNLEEILTEKVFDLIQLDSLVFSIFTENLRALTSGKLVYRQYFVESAKLNDLAKNLRFSVFKYFSISRLVNKIKQLEEKISQFDYVVTSVPEAVANFKEVKFFVIPNKVPEGVELQTLPSEYKLFFAGDLNLTNIQYSLLWFLNETWEKLREKIPNIELHVLGKTEQWFVDLLRKYPSVHYYSTVADFEQFISDKTVLLLPYSEPFGIYPEFISAMQHGKILVANPNAICCWGLTAMIHYMPARESVKFIEVLSHIYEKDEIRQYFSTQMFNFAKQNINSKYLSKAILRMYFRFLTQNV
jgi:glycosyltransferase involved in cell wall biosynthesis